MTAARAGAADWTFTPRAAGSLTLTDNVNLAPKGQEQSDLILGLSLPLGLRGEGARVKLFAEYVPTVYVYARSTESDNLQNNLRSLLTLEAVNDWLFVDASANIYQSYISPFSPRPPSGADATDNRTQQTTLGLSPYIRRESSRGWKYLLRNDTFWNAYSEAGLASSLTNRTSVDVETAPARLRYGFDYTYLYTNYEFQPTSNYQQVARVRALLTATPRLVVSARLGYETNDYAVTDSSGPVYGAGVDWTPTPRTKLAGFLEHRFFGPSYGVSFNHRTRRTAWTLRAARNTYTSADQPLTLRPGTTQEVLDEAFRSRIADPVQRAQAVQQFLQRAGLPPALTQPYTFYADQIYLAEQFTGSVAFLGRRNTAELTLFWQENQPITASGSVLPGALVAFDRLRQQGGTLTFSRRLSAFTTASLAGTRLYSLGSDPVTASAATQTESIQDTLRLSVTHQLSARTDGSIGVRWTNFDSDTNPYQELALLAALAHSF